jgi:hypothetical protein
MPRLSKDSAPNVQDAGPAIDPNGDLDDTTVSFVTIRESHSLAPLLRGLPGDSCQCPHWGYLVAGKITVSYTDREETYQAGDAFYMTPGHVPAAEAGTEFIQFSPREQLARRSRRCGPTRSGRRWAYSYARAGGRAANLFWVGQNRLAGSRGRPERHQALLREADRRVLAWPGPVSGSRGSRSRTGIRRPTLSAGYRGRGCRRRP